MSISLIYVTTAGVAQARRIGLALIEVRMAACVNILDGMKSIYRWNGEIEEADEAVLIIKTRSILVDSVIGRVKELHEAETPCALEIAVTSGNQEFLDWVESETVEPPADHLPVSLT